MWKIPASLLVITALACNTGDGDICHRFFHPYPDLISERLRTSENEQLVDAMKRYARGSYAQDVDVFQACAHDHPQEADVAWFYSANCYLALGRPYDAELQLDF